MIFNSPDRIILGKLSGKSSASGHMLVTRRVTIATLCMGVCDRNTPILSSFGLLRSFPHSRSLSVSTWKKICAKEKKSHSLFKT